MFVKKFAVLAAVAAILLAPVAAEARAGMGGSMGSRGMRSYAAPPPTRTAPSVQPLERSVTPAPAQQPSSRPGIASPYATPQPGFAQRNPFMTGLIGGLVGAGIGGLLFGHGFGLGGLGVAGGLGLMLQFALIAGVAWFAYSMFRNRRPEPASYPRYAGEPERHVSRIPAVPLSTSAPVSPPALGPGDLSLSDADFDAFERLLGDVQQAWSKGDIAALRRIVTPEMLSYFSEQLAANASKGVSNVIEDVKLEQADLAESWREGDIEYATASFRFNSIDYMLSTDDGRLVDGSKTEHIEATETWTFMRQSGGRWLLSAIQQ